MSLYRYNGPNDFYLNAGDQVLSPGDEVELDEVPTAFEDQFEEVESATESDSSDEGDESPSDEDESPEESEEEQETEDESVAPPFDPAEYSVPELEAELEEQDLSFEELEALESAEREGENRTTALDVIIGEKAE